MTSLWIITAVLAAAPTPDAVGIEHFEKKIRPVLVKHCYECHSAQSKIVQANLYLDTKAGTLRGGDSGPSVVPGKPDESLLLDYVDSGEMPRDRPTLSDAEKQRLRRWIAEGAKWGLRRSTRSS